ncbi:SDR family NAD(P)-dependent oxidoreductase [Chitinophaga hostae]|uniref:SDR family oxidoreductase n=1 Tax=Chitinophaga hostae TaxID=2831022 RepID=A0ABS5IXJ3_9BACT|nr:SDR family oxidoreductase [Chitinophaga hostae]
MRTKGVYIITGASGIAAETIKLLAAAGHRVFFIGKEAAQCETLADELQKLYLHADYMTGDLTDVHVVQQLVSVCVNKYGRIEGLFNVAGISGRKYGDGPLHECTLEGWQVTLNNNLTTQFQMCKCVLNQMLMQKPDENGMRGVILNMSSVLAFSPEARNFNAIAYATSKGAIISMTKAAAAYYAKDKIRINAIAPGLAFTNMSARASENEEIVAYMKEKQPLAGATMPAKDVAKSAVFLLNDNSCMITGETLTVDAGWSIS